jgi:type VII secretion protein EssA
MMLGLFASLVVLGISPVFASDDGSLQLDANVITNSDGGTTTNADFSIKGQLFGKALTRATKDETLKQVDMKRAAINFTKGQESNGFFDNYDIEEKLFDHYHPVVLTTDNKDKQSVSNRWYLVIVMIVIPIFGLSMVLGTRHARKRMIKRYGSNDKN